MTDTSKQKSRPKKVAKPLPQLAAPVERATISIRTAARTVKREVKTTDGFRISIHHTAKPLKRPSAFEKFRLRYHTAPVIERISIERMGVPSEVFKVMGEVIGMNDAEIQRTVRIAKATYAKKIKERATFDGVVGQSAIHIMELVNRVEEIVRVDPDPEAIADFDAAKWVGEWIRTPQPGLGGLKPADLLDTPTGRESVMRLLGSIQSGAYQ